MASYTHYLCVDRVTGLVVRRVRHLAFRPDAYEYLGVTKAVWKTYRAGRILNSADLPADQLEKWIRAQSRALNLSPGRG